MKPYMPSNRSEGEYFMAEWCSRCVREPFLRNEDAKGRCSIRTRAQLEHVAPQWVEDDDGSNPRCTAFKPLGERSHKRKSAPKEQTAFLFNPASEREGKNAVD